MYGTSPRMTAVTAGTGRVSLPVVPLHVTKFPRRQRRNLAWRTSKGCPEGATKVIGGSYTEELPVEAATTEEIQPLC